MVEQRLIHLCLLLSSLILADSKVFRIEVAIQEIFRQTPGYEQRKIDLVFFGNTTTGVFASEIIKKASETFSIQVISANSDKQWNGQLKVSSVLLFDSAEQFRETAADIKWLTHPARRFKHIVYAPDLTSIDVMESVQEERPS